MEAPRGPTGSAAASSAAKPKPLDLSHHYSETTKRRAPSKMKELYKFFQIPGMGNLAGGMCLALSVPLVSPRFV